MKALYVIVMAIVFGVLMSLRDSVPGLLLRTLIAALAGAVLGLIMQICVRRKKEKP